jgi:hypothetical protein
MPLVSCEPSEELWLVGALRQIDGVAIVDLNGELVVGFTTLRLAATEVVIVSRRVLR